MSDATRLLAIDNTQDYQIVVATPCNRIVVQENYNSASPPTADLLQKMPAAAANAVSIPKGTPAIYTPSALPDAQARRSSGSANFAPGDVAGTIKTASGSITVQIVESMVI